MAPLPRRLYRFVGPESIRPATVGRTARFCVRDASDALGCPAKLEPVVGRRAYVPATYIVDADGRLCPARQPPLARCRAAPEPEMTGHRAPGWKVMGQSAPAAARAQTVEDGFDGALLGMLGPGTARIRPLKERALVRLFYWR